MRARHKEVLAFLALLWAAALVFTVWPRLDVQLEALFFNHGGFEYWDHLWWTRTSDFIGKWAGKATVFLLPLVWLLRRRIPLHVRRRYYALVLTLLLGAGLIVNNGFKEHWGRERPMKIQEFGGTAPYQPALIRSSVCKHNCSFTSGHAAVGFSLMALGIFGTYRTRRRWLLIGGAVGAFIGFVRMVEGDHFLSDVIFSGLVIWGTCMLLRTAWVRLKIYCL
jgi:lipid A 4'-phosphatase